MNSLRLARWFMIAWLLVAGAVTLIASFSESYYFGRLRDPASFEGEPFEDLREKWLAASRIKKAALAAFVCGLPIGVLSWIYGSKRGERPSELESDA